MVGNFYQDLAKARGAERLVRETFAALTNDYKFEDVSNEREYFYRGDIKAIAADGKEIFIEVKDDSRIQETHNVLCETAVYYYERGEYGKGNMSANYDIYCVVSRAEQKIYVFDFPTLKANYGRGRRKEIDHYDQRTICYLVSLDILKDCGALIAIIDY